MNRWDVGTAIALVAVGVLAVVLLWRRLAGDRPGALAAAAGIVGAVAAAIGAYVASQRRRAREAREGEERARAALKSASVRADIAQIRQVEAEQVRRVAVAAEVERSGIREAGAKAEAGPAPGELEDILADYRREGPKR